MIEIQYERNEFDLTRGKFRVRGNIIEIIPAYEEIGVRIGIIGDNLSSEKKQQVMIQYKEWRGTIIDD